MRVGGQRHTPAALPLGNTRYPLYRRLGAPQGRFGRVRKISPPYRTVRPVASRCTDWAIPAHYFACIKCIKHETFPVIYELTPLSRVLLEKLTGFPASREILRIFWNQKVQYRIHKSAPPFPVLGQISSVHPPSHFLKIHFNIIFSSISGSSKWSLFFRFPHQIAVWLSPVFHTCHMHRPSHSFWFDRPNSIWWGIQISKLLIM